MGKVYSVTNGFVGFAGQSVPLNAGDEYDDSDPLVKACPQHFTSAAPAGAVVAETVKKRAAKAT